MKVAFTNSIFFKQKYGGISRYFCSLISELIGINIDIKVFSLIFKNNYLLNIPKKIDKVFLFLGTQLQIF